MTTIATPAPVAPPPIAQSTPYDADFDRRWQAWMTRGHAREARTRLAMQRGALALAAIAIVGAAAYSLLGR